MPKSTDARYRFIAMLIGHGEERGVRILLIEDESATALVLERILASERFDVRSTDLGENGLEFAKREHYDMILLDLNLPDLPGLDVLRTLRADKVMTPVMILSGLASVDNKVTAFSAGADDYMTKPFARDELVGRIRAIVRRSKLYAQCIISTGDLEVNLDAKTVKVRGVGLHVTKKEYELLELFSLRKGMLLSKDMLLRYLYGGLQEPVQKIIDVFMCKLRKKLAAASNGNEYFETVWGRGYMLREPSGPCVDAS